MECAFGAQYLWIFYSHDTKNMKKIDENTVNTSQKFLGAFGAVSQRCVVGAMLQVIPFGFFSEKRGI